MNIDSHQHFWRFEGHEADYVWMTGDYAVEQQSGCDCFHNGSLPFVLTILD